MSDAKTGFGRRDIFRLAVVGGAAATTEACAPRERRPIGPEKLVRTACGACPAGCGIVVRTVGPGSQDVVRITGIPGHPVNDGGMCPRGIAEIQNLYLPERVRGPLLRNRATGVRKPVSWEEALQRIELAGRGAEVVFGPGILGSGERALLRAIAAKRDAAVVEAGLAWGAVPVEALRATLGSSEFSFDLPRARYVLSLGSDWLQSLPSPVEAQRAFASLRSRTNRGRLVTADARLSVTAARSDEWIPVAPHDLAEFALSVAHAMLAAAPPLADKVPVFAELARGPRFAPEPAAARLGIAPEQIERTAAELRAGGLVIFDAADPAVHGAGAVLNVLAGAVGREGGLVPRRPPPVPPELREARPRELRQFPQTRTPPVVVLAAANPVQLALPSSGWKDGLSRAALVVSLSPLLDESALAADVVLPVSTPLEMRQLAWGCTLDGRGFVSAGPAAVRPLYDTVEWAEALLRVGRALGAEMGWKDANAWFSGVSAALGAQDLLKKGGGKQLDAPPAPAAAGDGGAWAASAVGAALARKRPDGFPLALSVYVPLAFQQGQGAHLPYLHGIAQVGEREIWRTVVELNPATAKALRIRDGAKVWVESPRGGIRAFANLRQGIRPDSVAIAVGLGRKALGTFAADHGSNPLDLPESGEPVFVRVREAT